MDPVFDEPWAHDARGYELRSLVASPSNRSEYQVVVVELCAWQYKDALRKGDHTAAAEARVSLHRTAARLREENGDWHVSSGYWQIVHAAMKHGDLDTAAEELLVHHRLVEGIEKPDLEENRPRTDARQFVSACLMFLRDGRSIGHPREDDVIDVMVEIHDFLREHGYSTGSLDDERHEAMQRRAIDRGTTAPSVPDWVPPTDLVVPAAGRDLPADVRNRVKAAAAVVGAAKAGKRPEGLAHVLDDMAHLVAAGNGTAAGVSAAGVLADAALTVAEIHDDPAPLLAAAARLDSASALTHLLRARAHVVTGEISSAVREVDSALRSQDGARLGLLPHLHAMHGWMVVQLDPARLDDGIEACRTGRALGRARTTPADPLLARLLVEKALHRNMSADESVALLKEALRLARRGGVDAQVVLQEVKSALAALTGRGDVLKRWRSAVRGAEGAPVGAQMRLAMAWVRWALGTNRAELAAEAYQHVVSLLPALVRVRYRADARARVLATVREHAEEAGYWLAKARRYRDAAVALETGRAVALSTLVERDDPAVRQALLDAGRADLLREYLDALAAAAEGDSHQTWARFRAVAREVSEVIGVIGVDPVEPVVHYEDITRATGDGAVVYVASAEAGGYALIVASAHDPQCVWLPDLDRGSVEQWTYDQSGDLRRRHSRMAEDLEWLWNKGMRELLAFFAHGSIITLISVGVLAMLPLHATAGFARHFPAVRYAPNARALHWCRARAATFAGHPAKVLVADVPTAPGEADLPLAAAETASVAAVWPGQCTRVSDATWERFDEAADHHDVWHISCHGGVDPQEILLSSLSFADRPVTLAELRERFRFVPRRLAIVAACDMHNVGVDVPNEVVGLPSALLQLGFSGVIAASWPVSDHATAFLMTRFHQVWRDGAHPAVALAVAQNWLRNAGTDELAVVAPTLPLPDAERGPRPFAHPWNWAAFAYTGG